MSDVFLKITTVSLFVGALVAIISWLPQAEPLPSSVAFAVETFVDYIWRLDFILPVSTLFTLVWLSFLVQSILYTWRLGMWILTLLSRMF